MNSMDNQKFVFLVINEIWEIVSQLNCTSLNYVSVATALDCFDELDSHFQQLTTQPCYDYTAPVEDWSSELIDSFGICALDGI